MVAEAFSITLPMDKILSAVDDNIKIWLFSYCVSSRRLSPDKVPKGSTVNSTEFQDFTRLVDIILARNIRITTLSELVGIQPKVYS